MNAYTVTTTLTDSYGDLRDTLITTPNADVAQEVMDAKVEQYDGSLWVEVGRTDSSGNYRHAESGATLLLSMQFGPVAHATRL